MEPYQLITSEHEKTESQDSWVRLQYEKMRYLLILVALLTTVSAASLAAYPEETAAQIDQVEEYVEATVKGMLQYYELDSLELGTLEEALEQFPEFIAVYKHIDQRVEKGEITEFQKQAIQHALNQELWRHFRPPMTMYFAIGEAKSKLNRIPLKASNPQTSQGITDVRADRITTRVYQYLPPEVQQKLELDEAAGHVKPESLADAVTLWKTSAVESAILTADIYAAIIAAYQDEIDQAAKEGSWLPDQKTYTASIIACCSSIVEGQPQYGYELLANPQLMETHWPVVPEAIKNRLLKQEWPSYAESSGQNGIYSIIREAFVPLSKN